MRRFGVVSFLILFGIGANAVLPAAETNSPPRKFSFQLIGRGDLAEHTVLVKDSDYFFSSDEKGNLYSPLDKSEKEFAFTNGRYRFEVVYKAGRLEKEIAIDEKSPRLILIDVSSLKAKREATRQLEELQVNASGRREDSSRSVLTAGEARFIPGSGGDALRSLTSFPGVAPGGAFANGLFIRGGDRFDVLYTYDDIRLGNPFHGIGFYSVFPTSAVENVEFYPGAFPAKFGNSQGAVVEINSKTSYDKTKWLGDFDANLIVAGGYMSIPLGKYFQLSFGGRRTYFEFYLNLIKSINTNQLTFLAEA
ncbi:MAG: Plug domain-containing protein, partial [Spirochaetia bacterium]|nr:Plug domain-containing protein [Spirochaetia bacterium]